MSREGAGVWKGPCSVRSHICRGFPVVYSEIPCLEGGTGARWSLNSEVQCIMGNGHMEPLCGQTRLKTLPFRIFIGIIIFFESYLFYLLRHEVQTLLFDHTDLSLWSLVLAVRHCTQPRVCIVFSSGTPYPGAQLTHQGVIGSI